MILLPARRVFGISYHLRKLNAEVKQFVYTNSLAWDGLEESSKKKTRGQKKGSKRGAENIEKSFE